MTNYEKIKSLSLDEMAEEIYNTHTDCFECAFKDNCEAECDGVWKWLASEATE